MIIVAITGASGVIYGIRLLEVLKELNIESGLVISDAAKTVIESETEYDVDEIIEITDNYYDFNDLTASINSGSFKADALATLKKKDQQSLFHVKLHLEVFTFKIC